MPLAWPGLAESIEAGRVPADAAAQVQRVRDAGADVVVLLCPYAVAARDAVARAADGLTLVDAAEVAADRARAYLVRSGALVRARRRPGRVQTMSTHPTLPAGGAGASVVR